MRAVPSRHSPRHTGLRMVSLWALCGLSLFAASCGRSGSSSATVPRLPSATCAAVRAAATTPLPTPAGSLAHGHPTFTLSMLGPLPLQKIWHPGATMRFLWCAVAGPMTDAPQPAAVVLTAQVAGPFPSFAAATAAERTHLGPGSGAPPAARPAVGPVVASTLPLHTDTWTGADPTATLSLPTTLAPGFYLFETAEQVAPEPGSSSGQEGSSASTGGIVQVTAP